MGGANLVSFWGHHECSHGAYPWGWMSLLCGQSVGGSFWRGHGWLHQISLKNNPALLPRTLSHLFRLSPLSPASVGFTSPGSNEESGRCCGGGVIRCFGARKHLSSQFSNRSKQIQIDVPSRIMPLLYFCGCRVLPKETKHALFSKLPACRDHRSRWLAPCNRQSSLIWRNWSSSWRTYRIGFCPGS